MMKALYIILLAAIALASCGNIVHEKTTTTTKDSSSATSKKKDNGLPFIGKRWFETRPGVSGTGTPHRCIDINENGEVSFSFIQINQADGLETQETYHAGPFKKYMKCVFSKLDNEIVYYEIVGDTIYEVDKNNVRIKNPDCREPDCGAPDGEERVKEGYICKSVLTPD